MQKNEPSNAAASSKRALYDIKADSAIKSEKDTRPNQVMIQGEFLINHFDTYSIADGEIKKNGKPFLKSDYIRYTTSEDTRKLECFNNGKCVLIASPARFDVTKPSRYTLETPEAKAQYNAIRAEASLKR